MDITSQPRSSVWTRPLSPEAESDNPPEMVCPLHRLSHLPVASLALCLQDKFQWFHDPKLSEASMRDQDETLDSLESKMALWHRWWQINGDHLECIECKACQWPWNAAALFLHEKGCANGQSAPAHPWHDLAKIIR